MKVVVPQTRPWIEISVVVRGFSRSALVGEGPDGVEDGSRLILRLWWMFCAIVSVIRAGDEGWSVTAMLRAPERALMREGRAVPGENRLVYVRRYVW